MKLDNGVINFAVYEGANEYYGMAEVALPEVATKTEEITGAGIAGAFSGPYAGHVEPMTLTLNFRSVTEAAIKLMEPRTHQIELRAAQQKWNSVSGKNEVDKIKYVLSVVPLKYAPGKVAPSSPADSSGEYSVSYYALFINGQKKFEIDIINFVHEINGVDYLSDVRQALGK